MILQLKFLASLPQALVDSLELLSHFQIILCSSSICPHLPCLTCLMTVPHQSSQAGWKVGGGYGDNSLLILMGINYVILQVVLMEKICKNWITVLILMLSLFSYLRSSLKMINLNNPQSCCTKKGVKFCQKKLLVLSYVAYLHHIILPHN